jgi:hypothetical protein
LRTHLLAEVLKTVAWTAMVRMKMFPLFVLTP